MTTQPPTDAARLAVNEADVALAQAISEVPFENSHTLYNAKVATVIARHRLSTRQQPEAGREFTDTQRQFVIDALRFDSTPEVCDDAIAIVTGIPRLAVPTGVGREEVAPLVDRLTHNIETQRVLIDQQPAGSVEREAARLAYAAMRDARTALLSHAEAGGDSGREQARKHGADSYGDEVFSDHAEAGGVEGWRTIDSAPKDGTILELVVDYTDGHSPLHDALIAPTIGWNDLANTGEDKWHIVGWDWCQDHIRDGAGLVRAWRPSRLNASDDSLGPLPIIDGEKA